MNRLLMAVLLFGCSVAIAQNLAASDADLKAAYCLPALKSKVSFFEGMTNRNAILQNLYEQERFKLDKTLGYLKGRVLQLSDGAIQALSSAQQSGEQAIARSTEIAKMCTAKISPPESNPKWSEQIDDCLAKAGNAQLNFEQCRNVAFLPY